METGLIDNALDFMLHAATSLWDERLSEEQRLKYSTVELFQGIELLLKARLVQEHWSLILGDPGKFAEKKDAYETYAAGDFVSVAYNAARDRLKAYCSVDIGRPADTAFGALRQLRNRYVHFVCTETEAAIMMGRIFRGACCAGRLISLWTVNATTALPARSQFESGSRTTRVAERSVVYSLETGGQREQGWVFLEADAGRHKAEAEDLEGYGYPAQ